MRFSMISAICAITVLALPASALAQDEQIGQKEAIWNLGELMQKAYPSTVTGANKDCPGAHDFHISLQGEAMQFLIIVGPSILTDVGPGECSRGEQRFMAASRLRFLLQDARFPGYSPVGSLTPSGAAPK